MPLLACANVANRQLARPTSRQKEIAVRASLGASRWSIARQLLVENILIALLGGALGLALASWNLTWTNSSRPPQVLRWMARLKNMDLDRGVVMFTLVTSLVAGVLCGLPAIIQLLGRRAAEDLSETLKEGGRASSTGPARSRLRSVLVISEVALALVLLDGSNFPAHVDAQCGLQSEEIDHHASHATGIEVP